MSFRRNKLFFCDAFSVLSISSLFITVLYFWYGIYNRLPMGLTSEYFYRAWNLYEVFHKESLSFFIHRLFFDFETLQPSLYPVITSFFLILGRGNWWWANFLQASFFLFFLVLFVYRFLIIYGSRYRAYLLTLLLISPFSLFRNFMTYSIEVGVLVFGVIGIYYLVRGSGLFSFVKAAFFLFLMALIRPIDGFALAFALIFIQIYIFVWQKECQWSDVFFYLFASFVMLITFVLPRSSYTVLYPLLVFEVFYLTRGWWQKTFSLNLKLMFAPVFFVFFYCLFLAPVSYKLNNWFHAGVLPNSVHFFQLFTDSVGLIFSSFEEQLTLLFFFIAFFGVLFVKKSFSFIGWRAVILVAPLILSVLGAIVIKNSSFQYHILGFFLLNLFCSSILVAHRGFVASSFILLSFVVLFVLHFCNYYSYEKQQFSFERIFNQRGFIPEAGCVKKNFPDPALDLIDKLKKHAPNGTPLRLYIDSQANQQNLFLEKFRIRMVAEMNYLSLNVVLNPSDQKQRSGDFYLSTFKDDTSLKFMYLDSVSSFFSSCRSQSNLYLYKVI